MKFTTALALAMPTFSVMAKPITDPSVNARIQAQNELAFEKVAKGDYIPINPPGYNETDLEGRALGIAGGLALVLTGNLAHTIVEQTIEQLGQYFFNNQQDQIWHSHDYCRTYFQTQGGGNCEIRTYARGSGDRTAEHHPEDGCHWPDAPDGAPAANAFFDPGVGFYSVYFTATNAYTFGEEAVKCDSIEGICNPVYFFNRPEYVIMLETWRTQGTVSKCQYSGGEDCGGICTSGVKQGDIAGGSIWGGDCAIPCIEDSDLPDQ